MLAIAVAGLWLIGLVQFLRAPATVSVTLPRLEEPPAGEHNLAAFRFGPTVHVSSYFKDPFSPHHPAFLVDERLSPTLVEKWASAYGDAHPFAEVSWREPRTLARVVLKHAGSVEHPNYTLKRYRLVCLRDGAAVTLEVPDNREAIASHPFPCTGARGVRIEMQPAHPGGVIRLYEIEAFGQ
jgi:hypothetical protein